MFVKLNIPRALTIAGSDSGGGAGIQADLKTFAAFGVHGMCAITAVTAQNTVNVSGMQTIKPEVVALQIKSVVSDIGVDVIKTGMLHNSDIIQATAKEIQNIHVPLVVDPVIVSKNGSNLLEEEAVPTIIKELFPLSTVVTPNLLEAEILVGFKIKTVDDAKHAASVICEMGPKAAVVKGGHLEIGKMVTDVLCYNGETKSFVGNRITESNTHGTGCTFASAIAANIAIKNEIVVSVANAKNFVEESIRNSLKVGVGSGPVNPLGYVYREFMKQQIITNLLSAIELLEKDSHFAFLIPECQSNIAMSLPFPTSFQDIAAIPGRIVKIVNRVKASSYPLFGASHHLASTLLVVSRHNPDAKAVINIRYTKKIVDSIHKLHFSSSSYDRLDEPESIKNVEGASTKWGAEQAIKSAGFVPDVIFHRGDMGKEPMILVLGQNAIDVATKALKIANVCFSPD